MIHEIADIHIVDGHGEAFEAAVAEAAPHFAAAPGCRSLRLERSIEEPARYTLVVGWDSVGAHVAFRGSTGFVRWRALAGPHMAVSPDVHHVETVLEAF